MLEISHYEENLRVIDLGNNKLYLKREDPFGFISINFDKGQVPVSLRGKYTAFDIALRDVERYLESKKRVPVKEDNH